MRKSLSIFTLYLLSSCSQIVCKKGYIKKEKTRALACYEDGQIISFFIKSQSYAYKKTNVKEYFYTPKIPQVNKDYSYEDAVYDFKVNNARNISIPLEFELKKKEKIYLIYEK